MMIASRTPSPAITFANRGDHNRRAVLGPDVCAQQRAGLPPRWRPPTFVSHIPATESLDEVCDYPWWPAADAEQPSRIRLGYPSQCSQFASPTWLCLPPRSGLSPDVRSDCQAKRRRTWVSLERARGSPPAATAQRPATHGRARSAARHETAIRQRLASSVRAVTGVPGPRPLPAAGSPQHADDFRRYGAARAQVVRPAVSSATHHDLDPSPGRTSSNRASRKVFSTGHEGY